MAAMAVSILVSRLDHGIISMVTLMPGLAAVNSAHMVSYISRSCAAVSSVEKGKIHITRSVVSSAFAKEARLSSIIAASIRVRNFFMG